MKERRAAGFGGWDGVSGQVSASAIVVDGYVGQRLIRMEILRALWWSDEVGMDIRGRDGLETTGWLLAPDVTGPSSKYI